MKKSTTIMFFLLVLGIMAWSGGMAFAEEKVWPKPGEMVGPHNYEKYKNLIPVEGVRNLIKNYQTTKMTERNYIEKAADYFDEATKKYGPGCKLTADGGLSNYVAGLPFTHEEIAEEQDLEKKGLMIGWNMTQRWQGEEFFVGASIRPANVNWLRADWCVPSGYPADYGARRFCIDKYGNTVISDFDSFISLTTGRAIMPPIGAIPGREDLLRMFFSIVQSPRDIQGQTVLKYEYLSQKKNDDFWSFIPSIRRVKRLSTAQRSATRAPADNCWDEANSWGGKPANFTWKYLGEEDTLSFLTTDFGLKPGKNKEIVGVEFFRRPCYIVEHTPKDPGYAIAKRQIWVSKATAMPVSMCMFDKRGQIWKNIYMGSAQMENKKTGELASYPGRFNVWDLHTNHCTILTSPSLYIDFPLDHQMFTIQHMYEFAKGR